jgi:photosystem II stability/assembly factor-like uncharacterized protein
MRAKQRKKRKEPVGEGTSHKPRSVWFAQRASFPFRDADPRQLENRINEDPNSGPRQWECLGPTNIGGRVTALLYHPFDGTLFAGTAGGSVWTSPDLGKTWNEPPLAMHYPVGDPREATSPCLSWPSNNVGALAMDPSDPSHVYCATGEANGSADCYPGCGILHSPDCGKTWYILALVRDQPIPRRIGAIAVDPFDSRHILIGGVTHGETDVAGLFRSRDGGKTWQVVPCHARNYYCHSIVFHPQREGLAFCTLDARGRTNGIWQRVDDEQWMDTSLSTMVPGSKFGRTSLAIAPSHPDTIYAFAGDRRGGVLGVFRSDDAGQTWRQLTSRFRDEYQTTYTNCIAVHPKDPDIVVVGGLNLHLTRDGGRSWTRISREELDPAGGDPRYLHGDHHAILILDDGTIISGNDGGVGVTTTMGRKWETRVTGMTTTMFYDLDVAPATSSSMGGGTQDNGTVVRDQRDPAGVFRTVIHGDGAWIAYHPADEHTIFGSYQEVHIFRHTKEQLDDWVEVTPRNLPRDESKQRAIAVMAIDPARRKGVRSVWVGTTRLWRTDNLGRSWKPVTKSSFDRSAISAIEVADDGRTVLVGTTRGGIFVSRDHGRTWSNDLAGAEVPMRLISRIETISPANGALWAAATVAGTGLGRFLHPRHFGARVLDGEFLSRGFSHVFASADGGDSWVDIDGGVLPDIAWHAAAFEHAPPHRLFIGGDYGVFMLLNTQQVFREIEKNLRFISARVDDKAAWVNITGNLPNVIVSDLVYHARDHALYVATYGRGIWRLDLDEAAIPGS